MEQSFKRGVGEAVPPLPKNPRDADKQCREAALAGSPTRPRYGHCMWAGHTSGDVFEQFLKFRLTKRIKMTLFGYGQFVTFDVFERLLDFGWRDVSVYLHVYVNLDRILNAGCARVMHSWYREFRGF